MTKPITDQEILRLYKEGEREASLRLFVSEYQTRLYSLAYRMLGNHDDAVDALQEIFLQVNRSIGTFIGKSSLYTWVYRLGTNVCLSFREKRSKRGQQVEWDENLINALLSPVERPNEDPDTMCETKYKQFMVQQAILKLPDTQRIIVVLHDMEGVSIPEAASILNINVTAAKSRLHRGREALRRIIDKGFTVKGMEGVGKFTVNSSGHLM